MEESADAEQQVNDAVKKQKEASDKSACFQEKGLFLRKTRVFLWRGRISPCTKGVILYGEVILYFTEDVCISTEKRQVSSKKLNL